MENDKHAHLVKMVQRKKLSEKGDMYGIEDGSYVFAGSGEDHTMSFDFKDVLGLAVDGVQFGTQDKQQNGKFLRCAGMQQADMMTRNYCRVPYRYRHLWRSSSS